MSSMINAICHGGAVTIAVPDTPASVTDCNCSICRRYGVLWAYYNAADVVVSAMADATDRYAWGDRTIGFVRCRNCGCITHWEAARHGVDNRIGINARNFEPGMLAAARIRRLDGASTWNYLDEEPGGDPADRS